MDAIKLVSLKNWEGNAENFKTSNFNNGTESSCNNEEQNLFLASNSINIE
jgi:hypothetical protein